MKGGGGGLGGVAVLTQPSYTCLRRGKSPSCRCRRLHEAALIVERELDSTGRKTADKNMQGQHRFLSPFFFSLSRSSSRDSRREITLRSRLLNFFNPLPPLPSVELPRVFARFYPDQYRGKIHQFRPFADWLTH